MIVDDTLGWLSAPPRFRWLYDKLLVAVATGLRAGPAGVAVDSYPVIWRPITNLDGLGAGAAFSDGPASDKAEPGYFWSEVLTGRHISTDALVTDGVLTWTAQAEGWADGPQRFSRWELGGAFDAELAVVADFAARHLIDYRGPLNVETIGSRIIEAHLRLTDDWHRAGAYGAFDAPVRRCVGIPVFEGSPACHAPGFIADCDGSRLGIVIIPTKDPTQ